MWFEASKFGGKVYVGFGPGVIANPNIVNNSVEDIECLFFGVLNFLEFSGPVGWAQVASMIF